MIVSIVKLLGTGRSMSFYAVAKGRKVGVYLTWAQCREQVSQYKGAIYKKFPTRSAAEEFITIHNDNSCGSRSSSYNPENDAVPLGSKVSSSKAWKDVAGTSNSTNTAPKDEFWPDMNNDIKFKKEEVVCNADLIAAMDEVEGVEPAFTIVDKKRKLNEMIKYTTNKVIKLESIDLEPAGIKTIGPFNFAIDDSGYVIVYTDGSCINNGKKCSAAGFGVYFDIGHPLNVSKPVTGRPTNNVGEIQGAIYAVKIAVDLGIKKLCISTDSQFLINSMTLWVKGWKRRNWRLSTGEPVKNVDDFKQLDELMETNDIDVKWNYVKAHSDIYGNVNADNLARIGASMYEDLHEND